jgi:group II intron reverse transcriptase/maturase
MVDPYAELEHLRKLATADPTKRFGKLLKIVRQETFLEMAWMRIRANEGSHTPGVDGQIKDDIDENWGIIRDLAQELAEHRYQPQPVRRVYIPKGKDQKRPLGIPTIRDRIVQSAVTMILEAIYEPIFRDCSYGFRPQRSTIHALRHMARAYQAGATWIIEGDLQKCFDSLSHSVILNCLRKCVQDEGFIDLIRRMLQAGAMEDFRFERTYSGAPQGGICSPILMNIVLHEFDVWMEEQWQANPPAQTFKQRNARRNREYARLSNNISRWRAQLAGRRPMRRQTREGLKRKLKEAEAQRKRTPCYLPRRVIYFCRYADDYAVVLCNYSKTEARQLKQAMAEWLQAELGLVQHPAKTRITHWSDRYRFLGYHLRGHRTPRGTRWLRLSIPPEAERDLKERVKRLCGWTQIPETDLFVKVNAIMRGWTQYYRYANNATRRFDYLTGVVFWLTAHYLGRKHRCSIKRIMRTHYAVNPNTGRHALYISRDDKRLFIWNKPPRWRSIQVGSMHANDVRPLPMTSWAKGHSLEQKLELRQQHAGCCQYCGKESTTLIVHHPNRLAKRRKCKQGPANLIQSAQEQQAKLLCPDCHQQHHHGNWRT